MPTLPSLHRLSPALAPDRLRQRRVRAARRTFPALTVAACCVGLLVASAARATTPTPTSAPTQTPTAAGTPQYNNVDDPLYGQRIMIDVTDLVVADPVPTTSTSTTLQNLILDTSEGAISSETQQSLGTVSCYASPSAVANFPLQTRIGRLYNQANDVLVILSATDDQGDASGENCTGSANIGITINDEVNSGNDSSTGGFAMSGSWVQTAMADFNFHGFDDLLHRQRHGW